MATVRTGEKGVDFSFAKPPAARLLELGYSFVVGYISVPPASPGKNISRAECDGYIAAGLKVLLVWEMSATSPNLGAQVGAAHGRDAKTQAALRRYPEDVPILTAVDTNTTTTNVAAHEAYVRAFAEACTPYPIGIYGDTDILARCDGLWDIGWVPNAWSWSGTSRANAEAKARTLGAHVLQRAGFHIDNLWAVDPNEAIADFPAWGTDEPEPEPPPDEEDTMRGVIYTVKHDSTAGVFCWMRVTDDDRVRQVRNGQEKTLLLSRGDVEGTPESTGHFREMVQTYEPVGTLNANAVDVLGGTVERYWSEYRGTGGGGGASEYVVTMTGTAIPGAFP